MFRTSSFPSLLAHGVLGAIVAVGAHGAHAAPLGAQQAVVEADRWNRAALSWIELLRSGDFDAAAARVDPSVPAGAMDSPGLRTIWSQVTGQLGALVTVEPGVVAEEGPYRVVDLPATFEKQALTVRVVLSDSLLVSGFFLRPSAPAPHAPPEYVDPEAFHEVELSVGEEPWILPGVLTIPNGEGPFPGVVLVHGSGPNDRDETLGGNRPFRDLAWGLASRGVAVLRYDKRTRVHGLRMPPDIGLDEEVVVDALAALDTLRARPEIADGRVFLLGHSLGGLLAPGIARRDGALAGAVVLAGPARPFHEVLAHQIEYIAGLDPDMDPSARARLDSILTDVDRFAAGELGTEEALLGAPSSYWNEVAAVDPVAAARDLSIPLLILQGGRDYQVTEEDFGLWRSGLAGRDDVTLKLYPDLNHLFAPGEGPSTPEEYSSEVKHVHGQVVADIAAWIVEGGSMS